ncbi:replication endonuclease [Shewanella carassii]|uniref:Replication gene A protein-like domain-containing protein n=1 Tax=Shewanella carassii TaxID=1987584 RepID=A0ABQ1T3F1_9GAMM|nr:replication endonuclease [Shewanella carassii]GGE76102.1 hypothetical protein GCM10011520_15830 [Shewanella carassii]
MINPVSVKRRPYSLDQLPEPGSAHWYAERTDVMDDWQVDLWQPLAGRRRHLVNTELLYRPLFERQTPLAGPEFIRELLAPLPHRIRNKLQQDYHRAGANANALEQLQQSVKQLLAVWKSYPFHHLPYLQAVRGSEHDDEPLLPRRNNSAPRQKSPVSDITYFDVLAGKAPAEVDNSEPQETTSHHSPFRGYECLRQRKSKRLQTLANNITNNIMQAVKAAADSQAENAFEAAYDAAAAMCQQWGVIPPYWGAVKRDHIETAAECGILRMTCPKWWGRQLARLRDMCCEHMNITAGLVNPDRPYVSEEAFQEWTVQQRTAMNWLENTMIENDEGVILPLIEAAMAGNANPSNRLVELIVRAKGLEEMADEAGMKGFMVTLTCPSRFHRVSTKWHLGSPREAQQYLVGQFAKIRSALKYRDIAMTGLRVAEPHKDGTPHWHLVCFIHPQHEADFKAIFHKYAFQIDGNEPGAEAHRLIIDPIDKTRGSAVGYVIKYLSKNIAGEHMQGELDFETGAQVADSAQWATAWASRHRLRQFQFYGTQSVQIWRELRRLKSGPQSPEIEAARAAACSSDWKTFEEAMTQAQLRLSYDITECGNEYGEAVKRIQGLEGIAFGRARMLVTRGERWKLRSATDAEKDAVNTLKRQRAALFDSEKAKPKEERLSRKALKEIMPKWRQPQNSELSLLSGAFALPWTCRNKCTDPAAAELPPRLKTALRHIGITHPEDIDRLLHKGQTLVNDEGEQWWVDDGQLRYSPPRYRAIQGIPLADLVQTMEEQHKHEHAHPGQ